MRKLLLLLSAIILCAACGKFGQNPQYHCIWHIANYTEETLIFKYPSVSNSVYLESELAPNSDVELYNVIIGYFPPFDEYIKKSADMFGEDVYWQILSEDGTVLKTWKYSERELPNQRFFEESSWPHDKTSEWLSVKNYWIFTISPEDIVSE